MITWPHTSSAYQMIGEEAMVDTGKGPYRAFRVQLEPFEVDALIFRHFP